MNVKLILTKAREKVAKGWTQRALARDQNGEALMYPGDGGPYSTPVCWCSVGAVHFTILEAMKDLPRSQREATHAQALDKLRNVLGNIPGALTAWNDRPGRTQAQVLAVFDRAIESSC